MSIQAVVNLFVIHEKERTGMNSRLITNEKITNNVSDMLTVLKNFINVYMYKIEAKPRWGGKRIKLAFNLKTLIFSWLLNNNMYEKGNMGGGMHKKWSLVYMERCNQRRKELYFFSFFKGNLKLDHSVADNVCKLIRDRVIVTLFKQMRKYGKCDRDKIF